MSASAGASASLVRCLEVALTIPDNEARTALTTLRRLDVDVARVRRADVYRFDLDDPQVDVGAAVRGLETICNASKHTLRAREPRPRAGEAWIDDGRIVDAIDGALRLAGRTLPGVRRMTRYVSWSLVDAAGAPAAPAVVDRALATLLCNTAFQKAIR